jgi:hypothetical protein
LNSTAEQWPTRAILSSFFQLEQVRWIRVFFFLFSAVRRKSFDQNWIVHRCFQRSNYVSRKDFGVHYGDEEDGGHAQGEENLVFGSDAPVDRPARYAVAETNSI